MNFQTISRFHMLPNCVLLLNNNLPRCLGSKFHPIFNKKCKLGFCNMPILVIICLPEFAGKNCLLERFGEKFGFIHLYINVFSFSILSQWLSQNPLAFFLKVLTPSCLPPTNSLVDGRAEKIGTVAFTTLITTVSVFDGTCTFRMHYLLITGRMELQQKLRY